MNVSYEGIGQWAATFACSGVSVGETVKMSGNGEVSGCDAGDAFAGVAIAVSRDETACTVALGGAVKVAYSGESAPSVGFNVLTADGAGGVSVAETGKAYLTLEVDDAAKTATIVM